MNELLSLIAISATAIVALKMFAGSKVGKETGEAIGAYAQAAKHQGEGLVLEVKTDNLDKLSEYADKLKTVQSLQIDKADVELTNALMAEVLK